MDLLDVRHILQNHLAEKLALAQGKNLFNGALPPGAAEGIAIVMTGIRPRLPGDAAECIMEITGTFESQEVLCHYLAQMQDLFTLPCPAEFLDWKISGTIRLGELPGEAMDRYTFSLNLVIAFV